MKTAILITAGLASVALFAGLINAIIGKYSSDGFGGESWGSAKCERLNTVFAIAVWGLFALTWVLIFVAFVMFTIREGLPQ